MRRTPHWLGLLIASTGCAELERSEASAGSATAASAGDGPADGTDDGDGGDGGDGDDAADDADDGGDDGGDDGDPGGDGGEIPGGCPANNVCLGHDLQAVCAEDGQNITWTEQACAAGQACFLGECQAVQCADECELGDSSDGADCRVWDVVAQQWGSNDDDSMHGKARAFGKWLRNDTHSLLYHQIVSVKYSNSGTSDVDSIYTGDTSLHTGVYLAAEAARLAATGSYRARKNVRQLVDALDLQFRVAGDPGMLATIVVPAGDDKIRDWTNWDCNDFDRHCNHDYNGEKWDYVGDPSRDMYVGPLMGMVLAYDALGPYDEDYRTKIREDLFTFAWELHRLRTINVQFTLSGAELPPQPIEVRFMVPEAADQGPGETWKVTWDISDPGEGDIRGGQEFLPNPALVVRQVPGFEWVPDIPRASSAMMAGAFIKAALHVTEGYEEFEPQRTLLQAFYSSNPDVWGNATTWAESAREYSMDHDGCGGHYFGVNLAMQPLYLWSYLEDDDVAIRHKVQQEVLTDTLWAEVGSHKNPMFSYMYAGTVDGAPQSAADDASDQLAGFRKPPRRQWELNVTNDSQYDNRQPGCSQQLHHDEATDVADRQSVYFQWHSDPWTLQDEGNDKQTFPGHDYLVAYWMGRMHGLNGDDTPGLCTRFE